ncbi:MAG: hypothetical protein A2V70_01505 [Planctomycetes bacterium RBG_13_63_9]|nr:MAG: hypothetical protein A2V70_01505 [Planctomycetes bacterium RBG_13_63_9]
MGCFYDDHPQPALRFGDIIRGFQVATPQTHKPDPETQNNWAIAVSRPTYAAVMTPCCSIERKAFAIAPLVEIRRSFLENEYLSEDLTRINRKVAPEHSLPSSKWQNLPFDRQQTFMAKGHSYVFIDCFIYEAHELLRKYELHRKGGPIEMGHYMVDFKSICRVDCDLVNRAKPAPAGTKILQLGMSTRQAMREKLSFYYGRPAEEDVLYMHP